MRRNYAIIITALTSTSALVLILYWLFGYLKTYFRFQDQDLIKDLSENCSFFPNRIELMPNQHRIQWITLILAIVCFIVEFCVFILLFKYRKTSKLQQKQNNIEDSQNSESQQNTQTNICKSETNRQNFTQNVPNNSLIQLHETYRYIFLFFILLLTSATAIGHNVKIIFNTHELENCVQSKQILYQIFQQNIILATMMGYAWLSCIIRVTIVAVYRSYTIDKIDKNTIVINHTDKQAQKCEEVIKNVKLSQNFDEQPQIIDNQHEKNKRSSKIDYKVGQIKDEENLQMDKQCKTIQQHLIASKQLPKLQTSYYFKQQR